MLGTDRGNDGRTVTTLQNSGNTERQRSAHAQYRYNILEIFLNLSWVEVTTSEPWDPVLEE